MYHLIINPHSRSGASKKAWEEIKPILDEEHIPYNIHFTNSVGDAQRIAASLTSVNETNDVLLVIGGDGTINEVLNGFHLDSGFRLGVIPCGSGNDFARNLRLPQQPGLALQSILCCQTPEKLDFGIIKTIQAQEGIPLMTRRFFISCGAGYDAEICRDTFLAKAKPYFNRLHLGKLAYLITGIKQFIQLKPNDCLIELDSHRRILLHNLAFITVHNMPKEGGGFCFGPEAVPDDEFLNITAVCIPGGQTAKRPFAYHLRLLPVLLAATSGKHLGKKGVHTYAFKKAVIKLHNFSDVHTDGEDMRELKTYSVSVSRQQIPLLR